MISKLNAQQQNLIARLIRSKPVELFGFQNANEFELFLTTNAGKETINKALRIKINEIFQQQNYQDYNFRAQSRLQFLLLLWLLNKHTEASESQRSLKKLIEECQKLQLNQIANTRNKNLLESRLKQNNQYKDVAVLYEQAINEHQSLLKELDLEELQIESEIRLLENILDSLVLKHELLGQMLEEFSETAEYLDNNSIDQLKQLILNIENHLSSLPKNNQLEQQILQSKLHYLNAYIDSKNKDQIMYASDGRKVDSFHHADFIISPGFKLAIKNNKIFLLKKGQKIENLSEEEKLAAENQFLKFKPELTTPRFSIKNSIKNEKELHLRNLQDAQHAKSNCHNARKDINNKLNLLHSIRASISNSKESYEVIQGALSQLTLTPKPNVSKASVQAVDVPKQLYAMTKEVHQKKGLRLSPAMLTRKIDRSNYDPITKEDMKNLLRHNFVPFNISLYSMTPIPPQAFSLMLQNMARLGANPYRPGVSSIKSPLESKENKLPAFNPIPKPKGY